MGRRAGEGSDRPGADAETVSPHAARLCPGDAGGSEGIEGNGRPLNLWWSPLQVAPTFSGNSPDRREKRQAIRNSWDS